MEMTSADFESLRAVRWIKRHVKKGGVCRSRCHGFLSQKNYSRYKILIGNRKEAIRLRYFIN